MMASLVGEASLHSELGLRQAERQVPLGRPDASASRGGLAWDNTKPILPHAEGHGPVSAITVRLPASVRRRRADI